MTHSNKPHVYKKTLQHLSLWGCLTNIRYRKLGTVATVALAIGMVPQVSMASEISQATFYAQLESVDEALNLGKVKRNEKLIELSKKGNIVADMTLYRYKTRGDTINYTLNQTNVAQAIRILNNSPDDQAGLVSLFKARNYYDGNLNIEQDYAQVMKWIQKSADVGNTDAIRNIGYIYREGDVVEQDYVKALQWYTKAAELGNPSAMNDIGLMYENGQGVTKNEVTARQWYQKSAEGGYNWAMSNLGLYYRDGKGGLSQDYVKAMQWFQKAAEAGNASAMNSIGVMYENGQGIIKDEVIALQWYRKATEADNDYGMRNIGIFYKDGKGGLQQDYAKAMQWFQKATEAGNASAMNDLGLMYEYGQGVAENDVTAVQWYRKAAEAGDDWGMNNLALNYYDGTGGLPQDYEKAMQWYQKAINLGNVAAIANIGVMYKEGQGVTQDYSEAMQWFQKAVATDNTYAHAYILIGDLYEDGLGVRKGLNKAKEYYQKAIDIGDEPYALAKMGEVYYSQNRYREAVSYFKKAAEVGSDVGMINLANNYEYGKGIARDYNQAAYWYAKALNAKDKSNATFNSDGNNESADQKSLRKLENLLTTGKITDPTIRKQVQALFAKPPLITWQTTPPTTVNNDNLTLSVKLTDQGEGIGEVRLLLDGTAIDQSTRGLGRDVNQTTRTFNLTVPKGKHTLTVQAYPKNNAGYSNDIKHTITSTYQPVQKPKLHAVVVGIDTYQDPSLNLKYATSDANAMYQALLKQTGSVYDKGQITLLNTKANTSKASIKAALDNITNTAQMNDVFVFYAASHGYNYPSLGYYLFTSEVAGTSDNAIKRTGLSADDLQDLLAQVKTNKKLVLLDSCASGDAIKAGDLVFSNRGLDDKMTADLMKEKSGAMVMMASSSQQQAIEGYKGHGLFTYSVLQGLNGKADMNKDGWAQTGELKMYVEDNVLTISKQVFNQLQNPKASSDGDAFGFKVVK